MSKINEIIALKAQLDADGRTVDILVNNAALLFEEPLLDERPEHFERMVAVNILASFWVSFIAFYDAAIYTHIG